MGLEVEGKEIEVFDFLATLEATRKKVPLRVDKEEVGEGGERTALHGESIKIVSWNVRGLNLLNKRGAVRWVLRNFCYDIAILQESKMEVVNLPIFVSLWGHCFYSFVDWLVLPSGG